MDVCRERIERMRNGMGPEGPIGFPTIDLPRG
jgi:hypothetical protein